MKKIMMALALMVIMTGCAGLTHCKECDDEVYKKGYCEYHYALNVAKDTVDEAAKGLFDKIFGD